MLSVAAALLLAVAAAIDYSSFSFCLLHFLKEGGGEGEGGGETERGT